VIDDRGPADRVGRAADERVLEQRLDAVLACAAEEEILGEERVLAAIEERAVARRDACGQCSIGTTPPPPSPQAAKERVALDSASEPRK
jgi:hypothetical protein